MIDRNTSLAQRAADRQQELQRETAERRLFSRLRSAYMEAYPDATERDWEKARPQVLADFRAEQLKASIREIAAGDDTADSDVDHWLGRR